MSFTSLTFLSAFLPLALLLAFLIRKGKAGLALHCVLGMVFLLLVSWQQALFFLGFVLVNYLLSHLRKPWRTWLAVFVNLGLIALSKLLPFTESAVLPDLLPLGLSYAALQALAFHLDKEKASFPEFSGFMFFLPKLPMGPVAEFQNFAVQQPEKEGRWDDVAQGLGRFILGLSKKLLLADRMAGLTGTTGVSEADIGLSLLLLAALVFPLQLYLDFSGYTDMALGLARAFGYALPENFRQPFRADSVRDFWRRWHMSLTNWLGKYVYRPLGGSRKGDYRTALNSLLVFAFIALWHGIGVGFLLWGIWNALLITLERQGLWHSLHWPAVFRRFYVYLVAVVGFVFFRLPTGSLKQLSDFFVSGNPALALSRLSPGALIALFIGIIVVAMEGRGLAVKIPEWLRYFLLLCLLVLCLLAIPAGTYLPFIYTAF